ncbi:penicillin-binding protein [Candidatus Roizmanbacteria bacterium]|nr:penicillin-binding protein [Candidatus Roizmanbacteria bacterium]
MAGRKNRRRIKTARTVSPQRRDVGSMQQKNRRTKRQTRSVKKAVEKSTKPQEIKRIVLSPQETPPRTSTFQQIWAVTKNISRLTAKKIVQASKWLAIHAWQLTKRYAPILYRKIVLPVISPQTYRRFFKRKAHDLKKTSEEFKTDKKKWFTRLLYRYKFTLIGLVLFISVLYFFVLRELPTPTKLYNYEETPLATRIYDRNGELLYEIFAEQNRTLVTKEQIPQHVKDATVAIEDKDFYKHLGINPVGGILRAIKDSILKGQVQGGSTITQQLIKNTLLTPERTVERKIKEAILAIWADLIYSKEQILELYLNTVPYGGTAWGIDAAAKKYFNKNVEDLTLAESALLAGLPQAPSRYSPFGSNPDAAISRQHTVLDRMVEDGYITQEEADRAKAEELVFAEQERNIKAPHFVLYVKDLLVDEYGQKIVEQGGLQVTTTLDYEIQATAEAVLKEEIEDLANANVTNGAALVTRPPTGEILAMVGSVDYFKEGWGSVNVTTRLRQPGSSIKPINYAIALENREITASSVFNDDAKCYPSFSGPAYCPKNYDGTYHGPVQTRFALANSYNIPAVKTLELNTVETMVASSSAFGIDTFEDSSRYGLSLTLGGGEVRMTDMAEAFGVFANQGQRKDLVSILEVTDRTGKILKKFDDPNFVEDVKEPLGYPSSLLLEGESVLSAETSYIISHILLDNGARSAAFGGNSLLRVSGHEAVSVKTGTTDDLRDNWTIGYTPNFLVATWVGNNDNTQMSRVASGVTGATPIWNGIMESVLENQEDLWPREPGGIVGRSVCTISGMQPASEGSCPTRYEYFIEGTVPPSENVTRQAIMVWKDTGRPATPKDVEEHPDNVEAREHSIITDVTGDMICLDCPPPAPPTTPTPTPQ